MNNKIIAVICVVLMLATVLAACGKKVIIKGKNGQEYVAATDADGSTILNDEGNIIIYVTDENGKYHRNPAVPFDDAGGLGAECRGHIYTE